MCTKVHIPSFILESTSKREVRNLSMLGRIFGKWGLVYNVRQNIKFFIQRGIKGYCDKDLWEMNTWFSQTVSRMMKEFSRVNISYPAKSDTICPGYNEMSEEEKYRAFTKLTYHIGILLEKSKGYSYPWELRNEPERIRAKDKAFNLMRDNFYNLWW